MSFVKVNYHLNKDFYVEDKAFCATIKQMFTHKPGLELKDVKVVIKKDSNAFSAHLTVIKTKTMRYETAAEMIKQEVEEKSLLLTKVKPTNIRIIFEEAA